MTVNDSLELKTIINYCEILINNRPWAYICSKSFLLGFFWGELIFGRAYYWREFCISKWDGLDNKNSWKHQNNSLRWLKTSNHNSPWAYIQVGLLLQGYLHLRFGGGGGEAYFQREGAIFRVACYWNFMVSWVQGQMSNTIFERHEKVECVKSEW